MFDGVDLKGNRVFVRADLNVPLDNGTILDDSRLAALLPTIDALLSRGATLIVGTHIDRPRGSDLALSTQHLVSWFKNKGYNIEFLADLQDLDDLIKQHPQIVLLENLRFFPGEQSKDQQERKEFAQSLTQLADFYVNDAFGLIHRHDTSITDLPALFAPDKKSLGYLIAQERKALTPLVSSPAHPFLLVIGGNKLSSKLPLVDALLDRVDRIAWCPAPVFTLLHAQGKPTGKSFIDQSAIKPARELLKKAEQKKVTFFYPIDYQVARATSLEGPLSFVDAQDFPSWAVGVSIGPKTVAYYSKLIKQSKLIFYNGLMGTLTHPETLIGVKGIFEAIAKASGTTLVAGGDSVAAARQLGISGIDHLSTGGGATLAYLSGAPLPGLEVFDITL